MPQSGETKCLGCSQYFLISGIQAHLRQRQECKNKFSPKAFNDLIELCQAETKKKTSKRKALAYQKQKFQEINVQGIAQSNDSSISNESLNAKYKCKGCSRDFAMNGILKHLAKKFDCRAEYTEMEIQDIKKKKRRKAKKQYYQSRKKKKNNIETVTVEDPRNSSKSDENVTKCHSITTSHEGDNKVFKNPLQRNEKEKTRIISALEKLRDHCFHEREARMQRH